MQLLSHFWSYSRGHASLAALIGLIHGLSATAVMALLNEGLMHAQNPGLVAAVRYAALVAVMVLTGFAGQAFIVRMAESAAQKMRLQLARSLINSPLRMIEEAGSARLLVLITEEANRVSEAFVRIPEFFINVVILIGCFIYLGITSIPLLVVLSVLLIICIVNFLMLQKIAVRHLDAARNAWDELAGYFDALSSGAKELKLNRFRRETFFNEMIGDVSKNVRELSIKGNTTHSALTSVNAAFYFVVTGILVFALPIFSPFTIETLSSYALVILFLRGPISTLVQVFPSFDRANLALQRVQKLRLSFVEKPSGGTRGGFSLPATLRHEIQMVDVKHSYYRDDDERQFTLGPLTVSLEVGGIIFVVGGNGSGKTTFAKLLTGLYSPESGDIFVDGRAVTDENRDGYCQYFAAVFSDFYLFKRLLGIDQTMDPGFIATCISRLRLDRKVTVQDGVLSTTELSKGQRKRLALLTALLENRSVCLFDEWAADQDPTFKHLFYTQILTDLKNQGKTVIVISHDERYFYLADRIIRLEDGQLRPVGSAAQIAEEFYAPKI